MKTFKNIVDFYIQSSIHVALSVYSLVRMSQHMFYITDDKAVAYFAFFGTIIGYNFVKYASLENGLKIPIRNRLKLIIVLSLFSFLAVGFYFFQLQSITQITSIVVLVLTLLYALPFFPNRRNARNWAGVKIYIVSLCWIGVTLFLPILNAEIAITSDFYLKCVQRFILIFVLILIFEIIDLSTDDPLLQTVPQKIGVKWTKILGVLLLIPFYFLEFLKINFDEKQLIINLILVVIITVFLIISNERKSRYFASFWVESIPILWWLMMVVF